MFELEDEKNLVLRTTYKHIRFLNEEEINYLEELRNISDYHARVYLDGLWGVLGDRVFEKIGKCSIDDIPIHLPIYCGVDFGWSDETAFTLMRVDVKNRFIYLIDGFAESKLDHIQMGNRIKVIFSKYNINVGQPIYCDSEDPRLIQQLSGTGVNARKANKPAGSVINGIMIMNTYTIVVCDSFEKGVNAINNYTWEVDKQTGKAIDKPSHTFSHIPDSMRYGLETLLTGSVETYGKHIKY
jgi:phage terminase large subunit